jgi:hypothetical protein
MAKQGKGSNFERETCKTLSLWWTNGERDDVFWRTAGSGARAKTRSKTGQSTFGQYGDIQATDPIGQPLIDAISIELKRGYSRSTFADIIDKKKTSKTQTYELFIEQAKQDAENAGAPFWILIAKRDRREALVFMPVKLMDLLKISEIQQITKGVFSYNEYSIGFLPFNSFLQNVVPEQIINIPCMIK